MKYHILIFILSLILVNSNNSYAQYGVDFSINAPGDFNFNTENSITGRQTRRGFYFSADGPPLRIITYTYDENGNLTREQRDDDGDGTVDRIFTYTYDENGNKTRREEDSGLDGIVNLIYTYTYDENGNKTREQHDVDGNGILDRIITYTYDENGNLTRREQDYDGDGTVDGTDTYTYDENGNLTRREQDVDGDGTVDGTDTYTYDENGNLTRYVNDENVIHTYTYDENENKTREQHDVDGNGILDRIITYTYDENGNLTEEVSVKSGFDELEIDIRYYTYDENGNQTRIVSEHNGVTISITKISYFNTILCPNFGDGLVHKLRVTIPESGVWRFALCGSSFENILALSSSDYCDSNLFYVSDGCSNGDASVDTKLEEAGTYYLTVAGKGETDKGNYNLEITRLHGLDAPSVDKEMVTVYPNPAENQLTVNSSMKIDSYQIFNALGKKVLGGVMTNPTIQIESLHSGSYFIILDNKNSNQKFIKKFIK